VSEFVRDFIYSLIGENFGACAFKEGDELKDLMQEENSDNLKEIIKLPCILALLS
jgi:hypothetical protein